MAIRRKRKQTGLVHGGESLAQEFIAALNNRALVATLKHEAEQNELRTLQGIASVGAGNHIYVTPQDIPIEQQADIAKASLNAHIQKAQALQTEAYSADQLQLNTQALRLRYARRKVTVRILDSAQKPVDTCYRNRRTGTYHINEWSPKKLAGIIEDIDLAGNAVIIRPTRMAHSVNRSIQYHRVYIVNPTTMQPMVRLSIV